MGAFCFCLLVVALGCTCDCANGDEVAAWFSSSPRSCSQPSWQLWQEQLTTVKRWMIHASKSATRTILKCSSRSAGSLRANRARSKGGLFCSASRHAGSFRNKLTIGHIPCVAIRGNNAGYRVALAWLRVDITALTVEEQAIVSEGSSGPLRTQERQRDAVNANCKNRVNRE